MPVRVRVAHDRYPWSMIDKKKVFQSKADEEKVYEGQLARRIYDALKENESCCLDDEDDFETVFQAVLEAL